MKTLQRRIFVYLLGFSLFGLLLTGLAVRFASWRVTHDLDDRGLVAYGTLVADRLPPADTPPAGVRRTLDAQRAQGVRLAVYDADGGLVAFSGGSFPQAVDYDFSQAGWFTDVDGDESGAVPLEDGRLLVVGFDSEYQGRVPRKLLIAFVAMTLTLTVVCHFVSRHITGRIRTLQDGVERLEAGDLAARVEVRGSDEVAMLMEGFNRAAKWIEKLVKSQKGLLANASHDFRSPLARLRLAVELLRESRVEDGRPGAREDALFEGAVADIEVLERMVTDLLLSSRLEALGRPESMESTDVLEILRREAARTGAQVEGEPTPVTGSPQLLARMVRNLLDNAASHGKGLEVQAGVRRAGERVVVWVADRGPGVPEGDRERVFEPYYRSSVGGPTGSGGFGLGLALVWQIARSHGGGVRCLPREGGGTVFEVDLDPDAAARDPGDDRRGSKPSS